jgi:hypothetical protein
VGLYRSRSLTLGALRSVPCRYWHQALSGLLTRLWSTARQGRLLLPEEQRDQPCST